MSRLPALRARLPQVTQKPGVYLMKDRLGSIIYVGKARNIRKRLQTYFMPSGKKRADIKTRALIDSICDFETHEVRNEEEAFLLEGKLIKQYRPRYNVSFRDDKRFRVRLVIHQTRQRNRADAILHGPDILEQPRQLPHDPLRHVPEPQQGSRTLEGRTEGQPD